MNKLFRVLSTVCGFALLTAFVGNAFAQSYPSRPIRVFVPSAAGSAPDIIARVVGEQMSRSLGQPIIVENKPGAGGIINMSQLKQAAPDGYTLSLAQGAAVVVTPFMYKEATYDAERDYEIIGTVASTPMLYVASAKSGITTLRDAIDAAKRAPDTVTLGSSTRGSIPNLANELLASKSGAKFQIVPFSSSAQGIQTAAAGDIALFSDGAAPLLPMVKAGRLKALALAADAPMPGLEDIPLAKSIVPGLSVSGWFVVMAPKGTPKEIVARLNKEINAAIAAPDVSAKLLDLGAYPRPSTVSAAEEFVKSEKAMFGAVIRETGMKAE